MKKKFNPKEYRNKNRIELAVNGNPGISKIWVWDKEKMEYLPPVRGKAYVAIKKFTENFVIKEKRESFHTLDEARCWRYSAATSEEITQLIDSPSFSSVYKNYEANKMPQLRSSTQDSYRRMIQKYFTPLMQLKMHEFVPGVVDEWVTHLKSLPRRESRRCFTHELNLLSGIIRYYSLFDDNFESPIKDRHRQLIKVRDIATIKSRDLTEDEFFRFRKQLEIGNDGLLMSTLATVQFFQALRISEVAGLNWEDIKWNSIEPQKSRLRVTKSLFFPRTKATKPKILESFKNSKQNGGMKEAPLMRESAMYLEALYKKQNIKSGFIFLKDGEFLTYRQIQHAYDTAFKKAGLDYSGTHIMRHGGARRVYNKSNGDLAIVQQLLGNSDYKSALVYAKRSSSALNEFSETDWESSKVVDDSTKTIPTNPHNSEK